MAADIVAVIADVAAGVSADPDGCILGVDFIDEISFPVVAQGFGIQDVFFVVVSTVDHVHGLVIQRNLVGLVPLRGNDPVLGIRFQDPLVGCILGKGAITFYGNDP